MEMLQLTVNLVKGAEVRGFGFPKRLLNDMAEVVMAYRVDCIWVVVEFVVVGPSR